MQFELLFDGGVMVAGTPLWNAEENQIADLVDFLAAHCAGLNEVALKTFCNFNVAALLRRV